MISAKILIVEDELIVAEHLSGVLRQFGYTVMGYVSSGTKVFQQLERELPDLILMDLKLKGEWDGVDIANQIKEHFDIPIIYLTAYADTGTLERIKDTDPYGYLIKPILEDDLYRTVEIALHKHRFDREIREKEEKLRIISDFTYDWEYWISSDRKMLYNSSSCERVTGYPPDAFLQDENLITRIVHPDDRETFIKHIETEFTRDASIQMDFRIIRRDGQEIWIEHSCQPVYDTKKTFLGRRASNRDISRRMKALQELELFKAVIESANDLICIIGEDGKLVYANPAFTNFSRYGQEKNLIVDNLDIYPPESARILEEEIKPAIEQNASWEGVLNIYSQQGNIKPILIKIGVVFTEKGKFIFSFLRDVSAEHEAQEALITAQKVASLGTFAAGMAHEMNSPLQVITGVSERLLESIEKGEKISEDRLKHGLEAVNRNAWRSASLVKTLMTYTQIAESLFTECDLNAIVHDVVDHLKPEGNNSKAIKLHLQLERGMPSIICDQSQIHQILFQLIANAKDAMPLGGNITIRTGYELEKKVFRLEVQDEGTGILENIRDRIFDPFFTTKPVGKGDGLGLSLVLGMVHLHGGSIEFDTTIGKGTTFWVTLPQKPEIPSETIV